MRIYKEAETELIALYRFGVAGLPMGRLSLRKVDGLVEELVPVLHPQGREIYAQAFRQLLDHWARNEYPDMTYAAAGDGSTS